MALQATRRVLRGIAGNRGQHWLLPAVPLFDQFSRSIGLMPTGTMEPWMVIVAPLKVR